MLHDARNKKRKKKIRDISRLFARVFRDEGVKGSKIVGTVTTNIPCVYRCVSEFVIETISRTN